MEELKDPNMLFDDRELDGLSDESIQVDEEFNKQVSKELDEYLKEHPLNNED